MTDLDNPCLLQGYHLRRMTLADLDVIMVLEQAIFPTPFSRDGFVHELAQNDLAVYRVLIEDKSNEIVGYVGHWLMAGEVHVSTIATRPSHRGRGLGELQLLNMLLEVVGSAELSLLEVRRSNTVAQNLYQKYHYKPIGVRKNYYRKEHEDAIVMLVDLNDAAYPAFLQARCRELAGKPRNTS